MAERKTYTAEEKAAILKRAEETSIAAASKEFGVSRMSIANWKAKAAGEKAVKAVEEKVVAGEIEVKKTVRSAGRKAKAKAEEIEKKAEAKAEDVKETAEAAKDEVKKAAGKARRSAKKAVEDAKAAVEDAAVVAEIETKKAAGKGRRRAKKAVEDLKAATEDAKAAVEDAVVAEQIEAGKAKAKRTRKKAEVKAEVETVVNTVKKPAARARAAKLNLVIQSAMGGSITAEEVAAKIPKNAVNAYVKVEENKIYWTTADDAGSVEIW